MRHVGPIEEYRTRRTDDGDVQVIVYESPGSSVAIELDDEGMAIGLAETILDEVADDDG